MKDWRARNRQHVKDYAARYYQERGKPNNAARYLRYRDKFLARRKNYYYTHREKQREMQKRWRAANTAHLQEYEAKRYQRDRDRMRARNKAWRRANPKRRAETEARRRARLRGNGIEKVDYAAILRRDKGICHICGKKVRPDQLSFDHLIPVSLGGPHTAANLRVAHRRCNSRRYTGKIPAQLLLFG